jgi:MFS family permease
MLAFMGVFALGETLMQPTIPAIANDLASDHTRGRYNAINAAAFQGGAITGPVAAGLLLDHDLAAVYIGVMVLGCLTICAMAGALERRILPVANGVVDEAPAAAPAERG